MTTGGTRITKPHETYRFIVASDLFDETESPSEEQIRKKFKDTSEIFIESGSSVAWAAMNAAEKAYDAYYNDEDDWPMILLAMDPLGAIYRVDVEMELRPDITEAKPTKLFEANVDDKTLPMFPKFTEEQNARAQESLRSRNP